MANYMIHTKYDRIRYKDVIITITPIGTLEIKDERTRNVTIIYAHGVWEKIVWED